MRPAV